MKAITSKQTEVIEPSAVFTPEEWSLHKYTVTLQDNARQERIFGNTRYTEEYLRYMNKAFEPDPRFMRFIHEPTRDGRRK